MGVVPLTFRLDGSLYKLLSGAAAGFLATAPMSVSMLIGWRLLPGGEKYHLPPRLITEEIAERLGIEKHLDENELVGLTVLSHFGFGTLAGALYALFSPRLRMHSSLKGALCGVAVWAGSYLGWVPGMDRRLQGEPAQGLGNHRPPGRPRDPDRPSGRGHQPDPGRTPGGLRRTELSGAHGGAGHGPAGHAPPARRTG